MKKFIDNANLSLLKLQCKVYNFAQSFREDERGVSPIVATVLIILITVLLAVIFWGSLKTWFEQLWGQITTPKFE